MLLVLVAFYSFLLIRVEMWFAHNGLLIGLSEAASGPCEAGSLLSGRECIISWGASGPAGDYKPGIVNLGQIGVCREELLIVVGNFAPFVQRIGFLSPW